MAENHNEKPVVDEELEKARKSMGDRVDPEPTPQGEEPEPIIEKKEDVTPEPKPDVTPEKVDDPAADKNPDGGADDKNNQAPKPINRPEAYIPMPKYLSEKKENERILAEKDAQIADALKKVEELTSLAGQKDGTQKDEDIEAFMAETGFDRATVDGFLKLAEKKLLNPERMAKIEAVESITKEAEIEAAFESEFTKFGEPELKTRFPNVTAEQLEKAKKFLDQNAHTAEYHDKPLDFIIYKKQAEITKLFAGGDEKEVVPQTKKTIEATHPGQGRNTPITAKDFEGQKDFSTLNEMEPGERSALIKSFNTATYQNFQEWVKSSTPGTEVMRNGQRVILK